MSGYSITFDPQTAILDIRVEGFFDHAEMERFATEFLAKRTELRAKGKPFGMLGDGSLFAVQSQETAQMLTGLVDANNQDNRAPVAVVAASALVRLQMARAMAAPHVRIFAERVEAIAWLKDQIAGAA